MQDLAGEDERQKDKSQARPRWERRGEGKQWRPCPAPLWDVVGGKGNAEVQELEEGPRGLHCQI